MPDGSPVDVQQDGHVLVLRINRPEAMNAINGRVLDELTRAVKRARNDDSVRCVVLTGAPRADGRPCFSAGDDLKEAAAGLHPPGNPGNKLCNLIDDLLKPSIAVVDGVCTTGAIELALACDLRVVAETAQISDWHLARLGSGLGGWGASTRLSRLVGVAQAKDIILTGKVIDGREAHRIQFAQRVAPSEQLWPEAMAMARAIAGMNPDGVRMTMAHLSRVEDLSKEESLRFATQVREWFGTGAAFASSAQDVLHQKSSG
ncbi:MAG: enoyl-CoA hydratase/isomerase family protein [Actinomycetota bacterium]|nr:enoyl-CoA hydratase/isomerase family protein [Actinomycetota bacterium]